MAVKKKINPRFNTEPVASVVAPIQGRPVPAPIVKKPKPIKPKISLDFHDIRL